MLAKIYLGYVDGVAQPSAEYGQPVYGQIISECVKGRQVLELWPFDFPLSAKAEGSVQPLRMLWEPRISGFMQTQFGISGLECIGDGSRRRWVAQRWLCEPMDLAGILRNLNPPRAHGRISSDSHQP